jgi:hypothetical protein
MGGRSVGIVRSQTQATTSRSLYDENDNDFYTESANSTNSKSHSREPLIRKLFSASNSQPNNRSNDSKELEIQWTAGRKQM